MSSIILGIDPGFSGGIAFLRTDNGELEHLIPMPITRPNNNRPTVASVFRLKKRTEIDAEGLCVQIKSFMPCVALAVIEYVAASPQMGVTSAFRFGEGFGLVKGALSALGIRTQLVYPSTWKPALGLSSDKKRSLALADELWPNLGAVFGRKTNDGMAEAALLAHYGWKHFYKPKITELY